MSNLLTFFLGLIQGFTEFLPISSTGHLILFSNFFNTPSSLAWDAFLHLGSFLAILLYFWKDFKKIFQYKWLIGVAIIPGGIAGLTLESLIEDYFRTPLFVGFNLILMSIPMVMGEKLGSKSLTIGELNLKKALFIGLAQALALFPGTSRSGITISAGLLVGLKREEAAKFSFLAGAPLILGAGLYKALELIKNPSFPLGLAGIGFFSALLSSFLAIAFLIPFLKKYSLYPFVFYRVILAILILSFLISL
ncbi:MAG: undecaprenyl-diphosphate phosphatase [Thermodesulfobacteriaceae bacterium]|nr:undecaprenyl-diphosphate phosphatase [Thermodesulfobacteriaceae bacterium]MCX8041544.1 undecaprenyl-diphosphate phosphatase [Thermodesulfobacteriaceae bacterium]MDW8135992.1 undecaprenyl-diphosphate phosphatase [Thermodesulfobacterium sp.]